MNITALVGRLTKDPELRYTQSGTAVCEFTLAVPRDFKNAQGEYESDFIRCIVWRKSAESFANHFHKGSRTQVTGRIETGSYEDKNGNTVYTTKVVVENWGFIDTKAENDQYRQSNGNQSNNQTQSNQQGGGSEWTQGDDTTTISDKDLPF
ncbi:single-stranded DNA-binding protein [Ligilactobacillus sp. LYQ139]|uniref:single-stranded DNA-binding protein n=1 Tax=Ligilactobacillus sp. LYQ139 TaxID=3378800 RepID=UPI0038542122